MAEFTSQPAQTGSCPTESVGINRSTSDGSDKLVGRQMIGRQTIAADSLQWSADPPLAAVYLVQARLAKAMKALRASLEATGLIVVSEIDIAGRLRTTLGMEVSPSVLLSVTCPFLLLEGLVMEPAILTVVPLHVVVIEKEHGTRIYVLHSMRPGCEGGGAFTPKLHELPVRIRHCLDRIAARIPSDCGW